MRKARARGIEILLTMEEHHRFPAMPDPAKDGIFRR
jgi:hypothetical protein